MSFSEIYAFCYCGTILKENFSTAYSKEEFISQGLEEILWTDI